MISALPFTFYTEITQKKCRIRSSLLDEAIDAIDKAVRRELFIEMWQLNANGGFNGTWGAVALHPHSYWPRHCVQ